MRRLTFIVPEGIDDPARVSGGNVYDREVRDGLRARGWDVDIVEQDADGTPPVTASGRVLIDGLCALRLPAHQLMRLEHQTVSAGAQEGSPPRIVLLAHMVAAAFPDAAEAHIAAERRALDTAAHVVVTSEWTARELERRGLVPRSRVSVAVPGTRTARLAAAQGREILCVGVIAPHKGQDVLLDALSRLRAADWTCALVGSPEPAPAYARRIARDAATFGGRVRMTGVLDGPALAGEYGRSALLVAPSRAESSGMAIAEARARGIPIIAAEVGGIPDTVAGGGAILVRPDDPAALARALGRWMTDPALRERLRREAARVRANAPTWDDAIDVIEDALARP